MKKDALITIRVPQAVRRRIQALARREGRSLSQQVGRLIERGMAMNEGQDVLEVRPLSGRLRGEAASPAVEFKRVRTLLSESLLRRTTTRGLVRR